MGLKLYDGSPAVDITMKYAGGFLVMRKGERYIDRGQEAKVEDGFMVLPSYSTDIAAAWKVVEKLKDFEVRVTKTWCETWNCQTWSNRDIDCGNIERTDGTTAPHAICLAALKAVRHKE